MLLKRRFCIIILLLISVLGCEAKNQVKTPDVFGIYISTLDGENRKMIISDHYREMNHVRVSKSLTRPRKKTIAANSYWTPDSKALIYISNENLQKKVQINRIDIATGEVSRVPTPKALSPSDPHQRGKLIVFPVIHADKKKPNTIWIMNEDGTKARQLTKPVLAKSLKGKKLRYRLGDFDPKISPDGSKVALMRQVKKEDWHIIV
ncbi:MAG: TolB family protein, partial [Planctomycetota bacterium]